jgi:hypothetical protein
LKLKYLRSLSHKVLILLILIMINLNNKDPLPKLQIRSKTRQGTQSYLKASL